MANKAKFEVLGKPIEVKAEAGNIFLVSIQRITQENGSSSDHIVINKVKRKVDGTQVGSGKQLFISVKSAKDVLSAVATLLR